MLNIKKLDSWKHQRLRGRSNGEMLVISVRKNKFSQALVAQAYNPSYS
jgi:hypothetical protein